MKHFKIASAIVDYNNNILQYDEQFAKIFLHTMDKNNPRNDNLKLHEVLDCDFSLGRHKSGLLICNNFIQSQYMLGCFYLYIKQFNNNYKIEFANWFNWLSNLHTSITTNYNQMLKVNNHELIEVELSSDIHAFNALYPLLHHSQDSVTQISTNALHGVLRKFINRKNTEYVNKDYAKCTYRRLETSFKEQTGQRDISINDIILDREKLQFKYLGEIYILNTRIKQNVLIHNHNDELLNLYLSTH
ncbi:MAG: hypothetical protein K2P99_07210 [Burkholderiales bacterium]|nr:hypothetical protein [Burkholderiales bacterium]